MSRIITALCCFAIGFVGIFALATMNLPLLIVVLLGIVLIVQRALPDKSNYRPPPPAELEHADEALEEARRLLMGEPTFKQVMPNLGGGQEL